MRAACNFHHRYTSTMTDKMRKQIQKNHIVGFLMNLFANPFWVLSQVDCFLFGALKLELAPLILSAIEHSIIHLNFSRVGGSIGNFG